MDPGSRAALIEIVERDGHGRLSSRVYDVAGWPLTIGRALDNHVVLDDPWVAPRHARIEQGADGRLTLQVLDTRNGVLHDGRRLASGETLPLGDQASSTSLQCGATRLRLRLPGEVLAPERPLPGLVPGQRLQLAGVGLALLVLVLAGHWIDLDPGADYSAWLPVLVGVPLALVGWCGAWALISKLFQHRFDFGGHLRIALPWLLALTLVDQLLPQVAAMLGAPWLWHLTAPLQAVLAALLLRAHLAHVLPLHSRMVTAGIVSLLLVGGGLSTALTYRSTDRLRPAPYMSTLPLPVLRLAGTVPTKALVQDMAPLAEALAQRVKQAKRDETEGDAEN